MSSSTNRKSPRVGFVSDERMLKHRCEWDEKHIETPERLNRILSRLRETGLMDQCIQLEPYFAESDELQLVHTVDYIASIAETAKMNPVQLERFSSTMEDIYVNNSTYGCATLSAGCAIAAMTAVLNGQCDRSFAAIRPPGHHAWQSSACGFCIFNNVAICAMKARQLGAKRVLIVDWDVHAGITDDPNIQLISMHRYEHGQFWPNLPECGINVDDETRRYSNTINVPLNRTGYGDNEYLAEETRRYSNTINVPLNRTGYGDNEYLADEKRSYSNTINVPLNQTGYGDNEYLAWMMHLVLPMISDFQPNLILVSCGYDAAFGDPEGEMRVTPAGFAQMTHLLCSTGIPLCLLLEGGYFLESVESSAEWTIRSLLSQSIPPIQLGQCDPGFSQTLHSVIEHHTRRLISPGLLTTFNNGLWKEIRKANSLKSDPVENGNEEFNGTRIKGPPYETRDLYEYPERTMTMIAGFKEQLKAIVQGYEKSDFNTSKELNIFIHESEIRIEYLDQVDNVYLPNEDRLIELYLHNFILPMAYCLNYAKINIIVSSSNNSTKAHRIEKFLAYNKNRDVQINNVDAETKIESTANCQNCLPMMYCDKADNEPSRCGDFNVDLENIEFKPCPYLNSFLLYHVQSE